MRKVIDEGNKKDGSSSHAARSKSPERSPVGTRFTCSDSQRSNNSSQATSLFQQRFGKQEKVVEDDVREDLKRLSRSSPKGRVCVGYMYGIHVDMVIPCLYYKVSIIFNCAVLATLLPFKLY